MRPGAQWCTLCHTDLRPAAEPVPVPEPELVTLSEPLPLSRPVSVPELVSVPGSPPVGRGKHARRDPSYDETTAVTEQPREQALGTDAMLALLAAESAKPLGALASRLDSSGAKIGVMAGGVVLVAAVLFVLMAVIGSLL